MIYKKTLVLLMAGAICAPAIAHAQSNDIMNRLNRMENEIQTLNRALYRGEQPLPLTPTTSPQSEQALVRMQQLEADLRSLTGRVEQQTFEIGQLRQQVEAMGYQLQQARMREPTPVVPQAAEDLRPGEMAQPQMADAVPSQPPPQPNRMGMQTATPSLPDGSDPVALYEASYSKIQSGDYVGAEHGFSQFLEQNPDHKLAANAHYWLGETYYVRGDFPQATRIFAQSYQKFPKGPKGPDNLLKLGLSLAAEGKNKDACVALGQLAKEYTTAAPEIMNTADAERQKLGC